eukprot:gnl/MRDRNA2_/MRDRNA2_89883_c0_seq1.p1 gnl/MRDRNA2_/MRDRNA2_89883_c0~~gnl/MRDRNA2_/MRDRNA2_89883_c0_seq1.p1  ORF type:complete len:270 (+),score=65.91 gnl/MRDRNA2_/MRDRNA2_89883_c0_seq1:73-882(+)
MGAGASAGVKAAVDKTSEEELKTALSGLSAEDKEKLKGALKSADAPPAKSLSNASAMGKWTDQECTDMINAILNQTTKGPPPELFRKVRPFHMPEYKTKIAIGQDAPDGKVFELDGTETTLLAKVSSMGHGPEKLMVLNFGSITCPVHRGKQPEVSSVCKELSVDLLQVYIMEAHPKDEWAFPGTEYTQTQSLEDRIKMAKTFKEDKDIKENMVVDDIANPCNNAYEAVATKAYVIEGGKIVWRTGMSPFQYDVEGLKDFLTSKKGSAS